jgi:pleckstrin family protein A (phosphoinositide binding specific) protein 8
LKSLVPVDEEMEIPTEKFLLASSDFLPILDKLGSKAFSPVKMDINGNIRKITLKYETDKEKYGTLQDIIRSEMNANTTKISNSATDAIMWLKRGLSFVQNFLKNVVDGETNLTNALQVIMLFNDRR